MPVPGGISVMKSSFRRPTLRSMPTESKAGGVSTRTMLG